MGERSQAEESSENEGEVGGYTATLQDGLAQLLHQIPLKSWQKQTQGSHAVPHRTLRAELPPKQVQTTQHS